jgi:ketosteroid isomerase-like protein
MSYFLAMNEHRNPAAVTQRLYEAFEHGDIDTIAALLHPAVELHVPGDQPLSGVHRGVDGVLGFLHASTSVVDAKEEVTVLDVLESADRAAALCHVTGRKAGEVVLDNLTVHLLRVVGGRVAEIRFHNFDQAGVDAFWAA